MATGKELAVMDEAMLDALAGMADKDDAGGDVKQVPVLKINYDADADHPRGAWVVGQQKDQDGNITEQGQLVKGLVILMVRNRFSYYDQKNTKNNCNSPFFRNGEQVHGSNYGYVCGKSCPYREEGRQPRCKAQKVVFGLAVTAKGKMVECIGYMGGASYMPAADYIDQIKKVKVKGGWQPLPLYTYLALLGSEKKKNAGTTYFEARFKQGPVFKMDQIKAFKEKRDEAAEYIGRINAMVIAQTPAGTSGAGTEGMATMAPDSLKVEDADVVDATPEEDDIPFEMPTFDEAITEDGASDVGAETDAPADADIDFDIDAAIKNALKEDEKAA